jgi:putative tryptophan/tyrosine transport system ATP-binding protein
MLNIDHLSVTLSPNTPLEKVALNHLQLSVQPGEWVVLVGGNGAGKSTLFDVIAGDLVPNQGGVFFQKKLIHQLPLQERSRIVSRVLQDPVLGTIPSLTIFENMAFASRRGQDHPLRWIRHAKTIDFFKQQLSLLNMGLEDRLDDPVDYLSGGQRQALSLLMALLADTEILLLDEITAALDPNMSEKIIEVTHQLLKKSQKIILFITHDMHHALSIGTRTIVLSQGKIIADYNADQRSRLHMHELSDLLF